MQFIASSLDWSDGGGIEWFSSKAESLDLPLCIEWNAKRAGFSGNLPDHPLIEQVDEWRVQGESAGVQPFSIFLPLHLSGDVEQVGAEISAADGWTDLASYINAPLMRLDFSSDCEFTSRESVQALRSVLRYMAETERQVSIRFNPALRNVWQDVIEGFESGAFDKLGEHIVIGLDNAEQSQRVLPLMSVEKDIAVLDAATIELLQKLQDESPLNAPYLIARISD